jgi:hypothetical protein
VTKRGEIAHKGAEAYYPNIGEVKNYRNQICKIIMNIDEYLADEAKTVTGKKLGGDYRNLQE